IADNPRVLQKILPETLAGFVFFHRVSSSVETPPFRAAGSDSVWAGRNPFQIRTTHRAVLYVSSCVLEHKCVYSIRLMSAL
ncbi:TPA: hypothetical protein ACK39N_000101, partial [Neisseria gonorrhoeae]